MVSRHSRRTLADKRGIRGFVPAWCAFLLVALTSMTFLAVFTPIAAGPDEPTHLYRVSQISDGHLMSQNVTESWNSLDATIGHPISEGSESRSLTAQGGYVDSGFKRYVSLNYQRIRTSRDQPFRFPALSDPSTPPPHIADIGLLPYSLTQR